MVVSAAIAIVVISLILCLLFLSTVSLPNGLLQIPSHTQCYPQFCYFIFEHFDDRHLAEDTRTAAGGLLLSLPGCVLLFL